MKGSAIAMPIAIPILIAIVIGLALAVGTVAIAHAAPAGDAKAGAEIYERCAACHSLAVDRAGPRHCGLFGRRAGSVADYPYSEAMKRSAIVWNDATLDRFLADPLRAVPGTSMGYSGISSEKERADLIAYLKRANTSKECRT